jgi:ABC-2 type transport system permease protein
MTALRHTWQVTLRYLRAFVRQPAWVAISLIQPIIWLLFFGALFRSVADIPGFNGGSYIEFLTPGVIVMIAVLSAGWTGMGFIDDINRGVMDRFLVSPIWRGALNTGSVAQAVISIVVQSLVVVGVALLLGAGFAGGVGGVTVLIAVAALLAAIIASLSNGVAVLARQRETLIGVVSMVTLPLTFLSSALMQASLQPDWVRWTARFNPVNWAAEAGRSAATQNADWGLIATRVGLLAIVLLASATFATGAFRAYQRSV